MGIATKPYDSFSLLKSNKGIWLRAKQILCECCTFPFSHVSQCSPLPVTTCMQGKENVVHSLSLHNAHSSQRVCCTRCTWALEKCHITRAPNAVHIMDVARVQCAWHVPHFLGCCIMLSISSTFASSF